MAHDHFQTLLTPKGAIKTPPNPQSLKVRAKQAKQPDPSPNAPRDQIRRKEPLLRPRDWYQHIQRIWYQDRGTKIWVPRVWYQNLGTKMCTKILVPGSWYQDLGTKILVPGSWYQDVGTKILVPRFTMGSQVHDWFPGSRWVLGRSEGRAKRGPELLVSYNHPFHPIQ